MSALLEDVDPYTQPSFTLRNRLYRVAWAAVYATLFRPSPRPLHEWRSALLRLFGAKIGRGCHVYPKATIWAPYNLVMDDLASMADGVDCYSIAQVYLGKKVVISQRAYLCTGTHDYEDPNFTLIAKPIRIESDAWICAGSFVGPGVTVGEGAVVGACSVAVKDLPPWTVCAGQPCKPLKPRKVR